MKITAKTVAFISGGASGLGAATARKLIEEGASVVLFDLPASRGSQFAAELGERARFCPGDVRSEADVKAGIEMARSLGELRIAVNCAGVATPGRILSKEGPADLAAFQRVIDINLVGTFNVLRLVAEEMATLEEVDGDRGVVVMTASVAAYEGQIGQAAYASSKGAIASLTITAARDLARRGIRVATIAPGVFATPMMTSLGEEVKSSLEALVPHPARLGNPEEYAQLACHIVANGMLNGEVIRLDGALRMPPK